MKNILNYFLITAVVLSFSRYTAVASHSVGGELTYRFLGDSLTFKLYEVKLTVYADCLNGQPEAILQDNPAFLAVYDAATPYTFVRVDSVHYTTSTPVVLSFPGACTATPANCILKKTFIIRYALPISTTGYIIDYQRCCRSGSTINLANPGNTGSTYFCYIPPAPVNNNSAVFTNHPPFVVPPNIPLAVDFSATDADGDSLSYGFGNAMAGAVATDIKPWPPGPPPFASASYTSGFTSPFPVTSAPVIQIDPVTGLVTGTPTVVGRYAVNVYCREWRGGIMVNTTIREFDIVVKNCMLGIPELKQDEVRIYPNPTSSILTITAPNSINSISITNLVGQVAFSDKYDTKQAHIDVRELPAGMYIVKINGTVVGKFVKE